jgi:hypothetical protein
MSRLRRLAVAATVCAAGLVSTTPTLASPTQEGDGGWLTVAGPVPLFDLADLAPGDHGEVELTITNEMPTSARFSMQIVDLRSDDFGCNEPESEAGDTSCGQDDGELDAALELTLREAPSDGTTLGALRTDRLSAWADLGVEDPSTLTAGATRTYTIEYELPADATNLVQSDRVSFALDLRLDQAVGTEVAGVALGSGATATVAAAPELPRTGTDTLLLIRLGAGAIAVGCTVLLVLGRKRERAQSTGSTLDTS